MLDHFDEINYWSEVKLDIVRKYAAAYSAILANQAGFKHVYIDAFAGGGKHISKATGEFVLGSPLNALNVDPKFREFYLIDLDSNKISSLRNLVSEYPNVHVFEGNCNAILLQEVFPNVRYEDYRRGLCLLDPYGLDLDWKVIETAGRMRTIDIFLNFPIMDMNRNVLRHDPTDVDPKQVQRMNCFWGDHSWRHALYTKDHDLFQFEEKLRNEDVVTVFRERLKSVAGFAYVPEPMPMRNSKGAVVYYLFFASPNRTGQRIVTDIFEKYRARGMK